MADIGEPALDRSARDGALVVAVQEGDVRAFRVLFERHLLMATGLAYRLMGTTEDLDDIVQESFAEALAKIRSVREPQAFASWLAAIVTAQVLRALRRKRLLRRLGFTRRQAVPIEAFGFAPTAPAEVVAELRGVYATVMALPDEERVMLMLHRVDELTHERIAELTGRSVSTVKRRIDRAERRLRKKQAASRDDV